MDDNTNRLRELAKEQLRHGKAIDTSLFEADLKILIEELSIYQIELEHQNLELIQSQENLQQSNNRYLDLFDNAPVGYMIVDINGLIIDINQTAAKLLEHSKNEFANSKISKYIHPDYQDIYYLYFQALIRGSQKQPCDIKLRKGNNSYIFARIQGNMQPFIEGIEAEFRLAISDISAQKEMELKLLAAKAQIEESEQRYRHIADNVPDIIYSLNGEGNIVAINSSAFERYGYTEQAAKGAPFLGFVYPDDRDVVLASFYQAIQEQRSFTQGLQFRIAAKDGSVHWFELNAKAQFDNLGNYLGENGVLREISDRKKIEEALRKSEERYALVVEASEQGIWDWNVVTNEVYFSKQWKKQIGYEEHEFANDFGNWVEHLHPDEKEFCQKAVSSFLENPVEHFVLEFRFRHKDGSYRWIHNKAASLKNSEGKVIRMYGSHNDITERKEAEDALRESEEKYREMANLMPQIIFESDATGHLTYVNNIAFSILGFPVDFPIKGKNSLDFYTPESRKRAIENINKIITGNHSDSSHEYEMLRSDGTTFPVRIYSNPIIKDGVNIGLRGIIVNIAEQKQIEQELITAKERAEESDHLKSAFLANMSHEIRTPMNGILGFAELLKIPNLSGEQQQEYIKIIEKSGKRMLNIINDIVDISKIEAGLMKLDLRETNINTQIEYIYTFFKPEVEAKGMELSIKNSLPSTEATIYTDREKVYAIFTNLVKNAIKYSDHGMIEMGYEKKKGFLEFFVKDTGIGIPKERQEAIFERFIQADITDKMAKQGAGLGLSITKAYIEMLGGKIWVESEPGVGSAFYFTLPYSSKFKNDTDNQQLVDINNYNLVNRLNILIAEDDEASQLLLTATLGKFAKVILTATTGIEAVEACKQNPDIDLILMDIRLPEMSGYEAISLIREFNKNVIIIAQTAYGFSSDREKAIEVGSNDYISKPIEQEELNRLLLKYFGN